MSTFLGGTHRENQLEMPVYCELEISQTRFTEKNKTKRLNTQDFNHEFTQEFAKRNALKKTTELASEPGNELNTVP